MLWFPVTVNRMSAAHHPVEAVKHKLMLGCLTARFGRFNIPWLFFSREVGNTPDFSPIAHIPQYD